MTDDSADAPGHGDGGMDADTRRMLQESAAAFAAGEAPLSRVRTLRNTQPGYDVGVWSGLAAQGWLGMLIPQQYGGLGLGLDAMRVVAAELARVLAPEPLNACAVLARGVILYGQNESLKQLLLPELAAGRLLPALAHAETLAGDDSVPATTAQRTRSGIVLDGCKRFVTPGAGANGYIGTRERRLRVVLGAFGQQRSRVRDANAG
jgi:alkylation response protein AidB-like acyl-CoA dehydrogenase